MADSSTTVQKISAEALGTFILVFIGCGTAIFSGGDYVAIGLAFGLTVLAGAYAFGRITGAHFNPAVSVGAALSGRMVVEAEGIGKEFAGRSVLLPFSTRILRGERVGILGPNGAGKTTLLKMMAGFDEPDSGAILKPSATTVGYLPQDGLNHAGRTVFDEASSGFVR